MKIVFIFRDMGTGGAQKIQGFVANEMNNDGHEIFAINMSKSTPTISLNNGIQVIDLFYNPPKNKIFSIVYKIFYMFKLRKIIKNINPIYVCAFLSDVVRIAVLSLVFAKFKIIGSERGDPNTFSSKQFKSYKRAYSKCSAVVFQLNSVKLLYDLDENIKQYIIPNPCIPRTHNIVQKSDDDGYTIVAAGRLVKQKRFDVLIDALAIALKKHQDLRLIIYGDGPLKQDLINQTNKLCIASNVKFAGDTIDVFNDAKNYSFFVLSSDFEGIPNVIMEAMSVGLPVISTDCSPGGARYLLKNGEIGELVECGNSSDLASKIIKMYENPQLRKKYSDIGIKEMNKFDPIEISCMWKEVFKNEN